MRVILKFRVCVDNGVHRPGELYVSQTPRLFQSIDHCVDELLLRVGKHLVVAAPLGLGKPNALLNALYQRALADPEITLHLYTALSLARPKAKTDLEKRFLDPFLKRHFGSDYPDLDYVAALHANGLPANVRVSEFYLQSGSMLHVGAAQRDYVSLNYTHVARAIAEVGINVVVHLVAKCTDSRGDSYSLSSNPDVTLDLLDRIELNGQARPLIVGQVHCDLPFLGNDAQVPGDFFDLMLEDAALMHTLFALPREPVVDTEYAIGLHASTLIRDGGTLQIGIGALSDALVHAVLLRHQNNGIYRSVLQQMNTESMSLVNSIGGLDPFQLGLYGASEMVMDGFMHLAKAGILKRRVYDDLPLERALNRGLITESLSANALETLLASGAIAMRITDKELSRLQYFGLVPDDCRWDNDHIVLANGDKIGCDLNDARARSSFAALLTGRRLRNGRYLHGAFYLGSKEFYSWLRGLRDEDFTGLCMTRVSHINELYGGAETLQAEQRREARFFNTCMMHTALGAAVSDALEDGQVVSGVGGQYNFVAMAHALAAGRSILMLRSVRNVDGRVQSNILWNYGHTTIPRHLRDIVITEYGIADLRGRSDEQCIQAMLAISDARFQEPLMQQAKADGKLARDYQLPDRMRNNCPQRIAAVLKSAGANGLFATFPFGSDFSSDEQKLLAALTQVREGWRTWLGRARMLGNAVLKGGADEALQPILERMGLSTPQNLNEHLMRRLLVQALRPARRSRSAS